MASKAIGTNFGVAKNAGLVILKAGLEMASFIWALRESVKDIENQGRQRRAVVVIPLASIDGGKSARPASVAQEWENGAGDHTGIVVQGGLCYRCGR